MATIDYARKQVTLKIVYYGCALSGKTTNLRVVHERVPADRRADLVTVATETDRTLHFDLLPLFARALPGYDTRFQVYTVPGQVFYATTRKLVLRGLDGIVFVADSQWDRMRANVESMRDLEANLAERTGALEETPCVLQYNKRDLPNTAPVEYLEYLLNRRARRLRAFAASAVNGAGVMQTLNAVAAEVVAKIRADHGLGAPAGEVQTTDAVLEDTEVGGVQMDKRYVLVVDADANIRMTVRVALEREGYEVREATQGREALACINEHRCDLMVLDVLMPEMTGWEVLKAVRENPQTKELPVIMLTKLDEDKHIAMGWQLGADYYVSKPFDPRDVVNVANRLLVAPPGGPRP
jgi:CheY-like chemotaxis protein/signal recognition particle receptor subunit beta